MYVQLASDAAGKVGHSRVDVVVHPFSVSVVVRTHGVPHDLAAIRSWRLNSNIPAVQ